MTNGTRAQHRRKKTQRDVQMSKLMKQIKAASPSLDQHQVSYFTSEQLSRKKMVVGGLYLETYPRGRGR